MSGRIVLAYSGSSAASAAIRQLRDSRRAEVVTLSLDLGQGEDLENIQDRALEAGALRAHVLDVREEFARDFVLPTLRAGALRDGHDPMPAAIAAPLVRQKLAEISAIEQASESANDEGVQSNLWGRVGSGYLWTTSVSDAPETAADLEITFEAGTPVAVNGVSMGAAELIDIVNIIAGRHAIGRIEGLDHDHLEAPAAVVLHAGRAALEDRLLPTDLVALARELGSKYARLLAGDRWHSPMREALDAFYSNVQQNVTGVVHMQLRKGAYVLDADAVELSAGGTPLS